MDQTTCEHLKKARDIKPKIEKCEDCTKMGNQSWFNLRVCLTCGHIGCCDSSFYKHATKHFQETKHPVMKTLEAGKSWKWCFIDEVVEE